MAVKIEKWAVAQKKHSLSDTPLVLCKLKYYVKKDINHQQTIPTP
jgi:hypothetical protein